MKNSATFTTVMAALCCLLPNRSSAQEPKLDGREGRQLLLENFRPKSLLNVPETKLAGAKFPAIDIHSHFRIRLRHSPEQLDAFVQVMDRQRIALCVSLDGQLGESIDEHAKYLHTKYPDRFAMFANLDWQGKGKPDQPATWDCNRPDFAHRMAKELADAKMRGCCGLKIFKSFGLEYKNADGSLIKIDDPRFDPIWQACGDLDMPIIIHVADPVAFFLPIDEKNERWEELHRRPEWSFYGPQFPARDDLLAAFHRVVTKHPKTTFIGAHMDSNAEDLAAVAKALDEHPNLYVEMASRISELGRQPYSARKFLIKYQDRVLLGTDGPWPEERLKLYWRFLETEDEYFPYSEKDFPPQGLWQIYGVHLPDEVLEKVYYENALKLLPSIKEKYERAAANVR
ncbi:amidohydrolase family protein [Anatilimnocola sp. NA78]|uniref:amidohydrolase family protein n=1 Tax=Anatilimnocola sp. NA78 TaxID=3415683 RepID=UPI003CE54A99